MKTAILIINWNGGNDTVSCLTSLLNSMGENDYVFIVDNLSSDNSQEEITAFFNKNQLLFHQTTHENLPASFSNDCRFYLIMNDRNAGFGAGNNIILEQLKKLDPHFQFAWLLNNDAVIEDQSLFYLKEKIQSQSNIGAVGSIVLNIPDTTIIQNTGVKYHPFLGVSKLINKNRPIDTIDFQEKIQFDYLNGASLMLNLNALEKTGYFDERYFLYSEEFDLQLRLQKAGYNIELAPKSKVYHKLMGSTRNNSHLFFYYYCMSSILLSKKHYSFFTTLLVTFNLSCITFLRCFPSMKNFYWGLKGIVKGIIK